MRYIPPSQTKTAFRFSRYRPRGLVYDRNDTLLAENRPVFSVTLVPERVQGMDDTLAQLGNILEISEEDRERFQRRLQEPRRPFQEIPLRYDLNEQEMARLAVHRHELPGWRSRLSWFVSIRIVN